MAEDRPATPEKQLLKLIEDPKAAPAKKQAGRARASLSLAGLRGALAGRLSFWKRSRVRRSGSRMFDWAAVNRALALAAVGLLGYVVFDAAASAMVLRRPPTIAIAPRPAPSGAPVKEVSPLKDSAFYLEKIAARDIFKEGPRAPAASSQAEEGPPAPDVSEQFSLVGISWSSNPDVIIENKGEQRTYFVKRGQSVGGGVKVEAVFKDHVVLSREGQEFEIR